MENALTIDVEDWYHSHDLHFPSGKWSCCEDRIVDSMQIILDLLSQYQVKATFFVLACIAGKHPGLIRQIIDLGHEMGSHGSMHQMVSRQNEMEFRQNLLSSKHLLEDICGREVRFYRAPCWSISKKTLWALRILEEEGFTCDSSIQPFKTPLSGMSGVPVYPFHPVIDNERLNLIEFPSSVFTWGGLRLPFAGGLYLRVMPCALINQALKILNKDRPGMIYVHPWELDRDQPRHPVSLPAKFTHYYNLNSTLPKLENLLQRFSVVSLGKVISKDNFPSVRLG